ncbi:hypothetical protein BBO99_00005217 [Phytophthora kernoviae]|uniref:Ubiquitin-like domain-containing protein n=2 Tax=Phytophthora kernoviae TaxID=325452 RepID=A0A3R7J3X1_9STRA|nr:hypothetical protein G195_006913 [Phytophthora kernoviae 00238/432]KAG2524776.1 hypothetical protein JM18_005225 [Phytophthora kernoviae]KAG2524956.1 hypothetical protein JM16_004592 [Phytophthora kernoviae]RLM96060.1 hypothetical protein BBI17_001699 [Phytophthora kernoviae]RLN79523.1 hypothetical protein BBO99_00005217 [Phytophthora kernoviae]
MSDECHVTVSFGKQSAVLRFSPQDPQALDNLKTQISEQFQLAPQYQRLVLRGRDVKASTVLTDRCKILLLRNRAFHENQAIDLNELDDDKLLVQVVRGKSRYDVIFQQSDGILDVKKRLSGVLGLSSPQALRLVVKGKTPGDETKLESLAGSKRVIKCMALLQAQQHVVQEKEEELRELLNELASAQAALQRVKRQMARNFTSREESLFELSRVLDEGQRIAGNLELVQHHLAGGGASKTGPRAGEQILEAVTQAIAEANSLAEEAQALLETHSVI